MLRRRYIRTVRPVLPQGPLLRIFTAFMSIVGLIAVSFAAAAPATAVPPENAGPPPSLGEIAIVPLDDRPFPSVTPGEIAVAGGHTPLTPDVGLLGEFFTYGQPDAVGDWWSEAAVEADASVVAIPMLAYGGLVASRTCVTDLDSAREKLGVLQEVKAAHPEHKVYAFDVIQRLTIEPTSGYPGMYSGPVRRWAELMDQVENLGREDLRPAYEDVAAEIPAEIKEDYLCARTRNHEINKEMVRGAAAGTIDFLVLGQDDASAFGPHRAEKVALAELIAELGVQSRVKMYPGADVLGALLTAKLVVERLGVTPTVSVEWSRTPGENWVAPFQDIRYGDLVNEYIATLGAKRTDTADADVLLMANTSGAGSLEPFVDRVHEAVSHGRLVAIGDDAVAGVVDAELRALLAPRIDLAELGGWSGWNVGISLAQVVVRSALLEASRAAPLLAGTSQTNGFPVLTARRMLLTHAAEAHQRLLFEELVHTDLYRNNVRVAVRDYAAAAGDDPQHMTSAFEGANALAVGSTRPLAETLFDQEFAGTPMRLGNDGRAERVAVISSLDALELRLGWPRYQELDVFPQIALADEQAAPVSVALLPSMTGVRPEAEVGLKLIGVLRNNSPASVQLTVSVQAPGGWTTPEPSTVALAGFEVRDLPLEVTTAPIAAGGSATVELSVESSDGTTTVATTEVTASWRNVALAASGATVTASGWWNQYAPERAIDGNTTSAASRWITEATLPHRLEITFAEAEPVDTVSMYQYAGYLLEDYTISALVDGQWRVVSQVGANATAVPGHTFSTVEAKALRIDITKTRDGRARLYEVEVTCRSSAACD